MSEGKDNEEILRLKREVEEVKCLRSIFKG